MRDVDICLTTEEGIALLGSMWSFVPSANESFVPRMIPLYVARLSAEYGGVVDGRVMPADIKDLKDWIDLKCWCLPAIAEFWAELVTYQKFNSPKMICWWRREILTHAYNQIQEVVNVARPKKDVDDTPVEVLWTFVQCELDDEEIAAGLGQFSDGGVLWDMAVATMQEGYKLSITYDDKSDSFCASLTGKNCPKPNLGKTITAWYDDPSSALALVLYKNTVKLGGVWANPNEGKKRRG